MDWLTVFSAMMFPIFLLVVLGFNLLRLDVQHARIPGRDKALKVKKQ